MIHNWLPLKLLLLPECSPLFFNYLPTNLSHNQSQNMINLRFIQCPALLDSMPFLNASDRDEKIGLNVYRYPD